MWLRGSRNRRWNSDHPRPVVGSSEDPRPPYHRALGSPAWTRRPDSRREADMTAMMRGRAVGQRVAAGRELTTPHAPLPRRGWGVHRTTTGSVRNAESWREAQAAGPGLHHPQQAGGLTRARERLRPRRMSGTTTASWPSCWNDPGIVRNRLKVRVDGDHGRPSPGLRGVGSFDAYLWAWATGPDRQTGYVERRDLPAGRKCRRIGIGTEDAWVNLRGIDDRLRLPTVRGSGQRPIGNLSGFEAGLRMTAMLHHETGRCRWEQAPPPVLTMACSQTTAIP